MDTVNGSQGFTPLTQKYQPKRIEDFVGLDKPKRILSKLANAPYDSTWLFVGPTSTGKTTMALALCEEIAGELIHIPSQHCTVAELESALSRTQYVPMQGKRFWVVLVDEADQMSDKAQLALLSKLDATGYQRGVIYIFTCNSTENLERRFLSRTRQIEFSSYGMAEQIVAFLGHVWATEVHGVECPDFTRMVKDSRNNLRDCLNQLETEILAA